MEGVWGFVFCSGWELDRARVDVFPVDTHQGLRAPHCVAAPRGAPVADSIQPGEGNPRKMLTLVRSEIPRLGRFLVYYTLTLTHSSDGLEGSALSMERKSGDGVRSSYCLACL